MAQKNLDVTGHNLGNIGTVGFTRQRVDTSSLSISSFQYWQSRISRLSLAGQGVTAFGVSQIRNEYLDKRYRDVVPQARELDVKLRIMNELETTLDTIDNYALLHAFNELKSQLEQVSLVQADAREMTSQIRNQVRNISNMMRVYHNELTQMLDRNVTELKNSVTATNQLIDKIVEYNKAITGEYLTDAGRIMMGQGVSEYGPLELLDQRNLLLDELAEYGNIEVFQNNNGSVRVTLAGVTIIDDTFSSKLVMHDFYDFNAAVITFSNGTEFRPKNGEIKAYMDMVSGNGPYAVGRYQSSEYGIPYYIQALNAFAAGFASLMNNTNHADLDNPDTWSRTLIWGGFEMNADGTPRQATDIDGNLLFELNADGTQNLNAPIYVKAKVDASNIKVSDNWLADSMLIGHTFLETAVSNYTAGVQAAGSVFLAPNGNYYLVTGTNSVDTAARDIADVDTWGDVVQILPRAQAANLFAPTRTNYAHNEVFLCPNTNVFYQVTTDHPVGTTIGNLHEAREAVPPRIVAVGVSESRWQAANLDGSNLLRFVRALETPQSWGRSADFNGNAFEYLMFLSDRLATGIKFTQEQLDIAMDTVNTLLDNRDAISGVSETEEGINMLTYQKWFNASARLMTTMDEALDTIINRMGRVGL
jgi:flagellar hook-associated protein FlgK